MAMSKEDLKDIVDAVNAANNQAAQGVEHANNEHCKVRWRRRIIFFTVVSVGVYFIGEYEHVEVFTKSFEFLAAPLLDKAIFGVAEA